MSELKLKDWGLIFVVFNLLAVLVAYCTGNFGYGGNVIVFFICLVATNMWMVNRCFKGEKQK